ncbi:hypothetical protein LX36DRAFT_655853 [Colletotrichum falcatum]|nr:hypothetical protein LX36DRAFT_655853 [Colletotrichum falcatum]
MKFPSLAAASSLALLALARGALGCAAYRNCHCYNDDGNPNDAATQTVCERFDSGSTSFADGVCNYVGKDSVARGKYIYYYGMDNCDWRDMCTAAGATGADSSCDDKAPGNRWEYPSHN